MAKVRGAVEADSVRKPEDRPKMEAAAAVAAWQVRAGPVGLGFWSYCRARVGSRERKLSSRMTAPGPWRPPTRNWRSGLTRGETIVDSAGGGAELEWVQGCGGWFLPSRVAARLRKAGRPSVGGAGPSVAWIVVSHLVESSLTSLRYLMPLPYQQRGMREDTDHSSLSLFWINV